MPARSLCLLRENCWQSYESPHSNGLVVKEQKWLKTKGRNSWGWMSDDKCISTRWHFHHHLIDHLGDILNCGLCECVCVCVSYAESGRWKQLLNTHTHTRAFGHWMNISATGWDHGSVGVVVVVVSLGQIFAILFYLLVRWSTSRHSMKGRDTQWVSPAAHLHTRWAESTSESASGNDKTGGGGKCHI